MALVDAAVMPIKGKFSIPLHNHTSLPSRLEKGLYIGFLTQIDTHIVNGVECLAIYEPSVDSLQSSTKEGPTISSVWTLRDKDNGL
jgi:hypothetical protein